MSTPRTSPRSLAIDAAGAFIVGILAGWFAGSRGEEFSWGVAGPYFAGGLVAASVLWAVAELVRVLSDDDD